MQGAVTHKRSPICVILLHPILDVIKSVSDDNGVLDSDITSFFMFLVFRIQFDFYPKIFTYLQFNVYCENKTNTIQLTQ